MSTILIAPSPALSHFNATFDLAESLQKKGHKVVYTSDNEEFEELVNKQGFLFKKLIVGDFNEGMQAYNLQKMNIFKKYFILLQIQKTVNKIYLKGDLFNEIIDEFQPSLIILDTNYINFVMLLRKYSINIIALCTMFPLDKEANVPPITTGYIPKNSFWSRIYIQFLWTAYFAKINLRNNLYRVIFLGIPYGLADIRLLTAIARKQNLSMKEILIRKRSLFFKFKDIPEITSAPPALDFPRDKKPLYLNMNTVIRRKELGYDDKYVEDLEKIIRQKQRSLAEGNDYKVFYCSLGTMNVEHYKECGSFLKMVVAAFEESNDTCLILTTGMVDVKEVTSTSSNIYIYKHLPQLDALRHSDIFITHGGLQSITESIMAQVPMIVYPLNNIWDQNGNAARVVYHRIGIKENIKHISVKKIIESCGRIRAQYEYFKENIRQIKTKIIASDNKDALTLIDSMLAS